MSRNCTSDPSNEMRLQQPDPCPCIRLARGPPRPASENGSSSSSWLILKLLLGGAVVKPHCSNDQPCLQKMTTIHWCSNSAPPC